MANQTGLSDIDKLWSDLLNNVLDAPQRLKLLKQVTSDLKAEVTQRPDTATLLDTLSQVFKERPLTEDMWSAAELALGLAYGPAAVRLVRWLITDEDEVADRLDEISPMLDPGSEALLRNILTRHAADLVWSYFAWSFDADEWRSMNFYTRQSLDGSNYFTDVSLVKVNGEQFDFRMRANQLIILARGFLKALNDHPSAAFTSPDLVEYFLQEARLIVDTLSATTSAPQENAPSVATDEQTPDETARSPVNDEVGG